MSHDMMSDAFGMPDGTPEERLLPVFDEDGHADEGTIHTWLDGMFDDEASAEVEAHVVGCARCQEAVAEARGLIAGTSRVLDALDGPLAAPVASVLPASVARSAAPARPRVAARTWGWMGGLAAAAVAVFVVQGRMGGFEGQQTAEAGVAEAVKAEALDTAAGEAGRAAGAGRAPAAAPAVAQAPVPAESEGTALKALAEGRERSGASGEARKRAADVAVASSPTPTPAPAAPSAAAAPAPASAPTPAPVQAFRLAEAADAAAVVAAVEVVGVVRDGDTQAPLSQVQVQVTYQASSGQKVSAALTDATGAYRVRLADAKRPSGAQLLVRRIGYTANRQTVSLDRDIVVMDIGLHRMVQSLAAVAVAAQERKASASIGSVAVSPPADGRGVAGGIARAAQSPPARTFAISPAPVSMQDAAANRPPGGGMSREQYDRIEDNPFLGVRNNPLSTFSIDVDRASYGNMRRFITQGQRPPKDAVRIEELVNYFPYDLPAPEGNDPVRITTETMQAPWQPRHRLVRIALQAQRIETRNLPPNNLVFLVDVSGSMMSPDKLTLVKQALRLLVNELRPQDRVALVTYAGNAGVVLPGTSGDEKVRINEAIDRLEAGGSTAGGAGLALAYDVAREAFRNGGNNRVILATDGDFNVGVSSDAELERMIERRRNEGTYLTVLGFGTGNFQAAKMEKLAKVGNGNFAYIDRLDEARKTLVEELGATLRTVANDVKLQVEFNPATVRAYRLIGYENRLLRNEDFADDTKDAGDIGAGHQVTALYEVVPVGVTGTVPVRDVDSLRYRQPSSDPDFTASRGSGNEIGFVKLRYKRPGESTSRLLSAPVAANTRGNGSGGGSADFRFAAAVASFGMVLRDSEYRGNSSAAQVLETARAALGRDVGGYRAAFVELVERWRSVGTTSDGRR